MAVERRRRVVNGHGTSGNTAEGWFSKPAIVVEGGTLERLPSIQSNNL